MIKWTVVAILAICLAVAVGATAFVVRKGSTKDAAVTFLNATLGQPASADPSTIRFVVHTGDSAAAVGDGLASASVIRSGLAFRIVVRLEGLESRLQAGQYDLRANMQVSEVVASIAQGRMTGGFITIPEGWRAAEVADALERAGVTDRAEFLAYVQSPSNDGGSVALSAPAGRGLEGFLFPDSYRLERGSSARLVADQMVANFRSRVPPDLVIGFQASQLNVYQAVTLASIVEREAVVPNERPIIASVYFNRLKRGMRLQADPTVQFTVAGDVAAPPASVTYWKTALSLTDLAMSSPYNTYQVTGLPPGPICSPGLAALSAVAHPATTDFLYFVAKRDGSHAFAATLQEHQQNVARYRT